MARKYYLDSQREQDLDSIKTIEEKKNRSGAKSAFHDTGEKIDHVSKLRTTKMIVDFCTKEPVSIKSLAVKEKQEVQVNQIFVWKNVNVCKAFL